MWFPVFKNRTGSQSNDETFSTSAFCLALLDRLWIHLPRQIKTNYEWTFLGNRALIWY